MAHGIFSRNTRQLIREFHLWQRRWHKARKEHRIQLRRRMIELRLTRLKAIED